MQVQFCMWLLETIRIRNLLKDEIKQKFFSIYNIEIDDRTIYRWIQEINCYLCNYNDYTFTIQYSRDEKMYIKQFNLEA